MQAMLIFRNEGIDVPAISAGEGGRAFFQQFVDWAEDLEKRGKLVEVGALKSSGGKTVRNKGGAVVVDGPFAEGREAVLGLYVVEVRDVEEACALAAESPHTKAGGTTEVRELAAFPKPARLTTR